MIEKIEKIEGEFKYLMGALGAKVKVDNATAPGKHLHIFKGACGQLRL